jgi:16S rRNA (adenine1518-N6/adenine1519-N6)-dimethyltransferase
MATPPSVMLAKYGLAPSKQRGQNFLCDENVTRKVVAAVGAGPDDVVVEIGPGFGALTLGLAEAAGRVFAVEFDGGVARAFREEYGDIDGLTLVEGDILDFDLQGAAARSGVAGLIVVGNIPYSLTSPLLRLMIEQRDVISRAVLMIQAEVGERMAAGPGDDDYSGLSVVARYHATVRHLFSVRKTCFYPKPKVDSSVVELAFGTAEERASDPDVFVRVVQAAFGKRRKMLRGSLARVLKDEGLTASELEQASGIDMSRRGETLSVEEFDRLAKALARPSE